MMTSNDATTVVLVGPTSSSVPTLLLARRQLRVLWAASFPEACLVAESIAPRLILVFGRLPKKHFHELVRKARAQRNTVCVYVHESGDQRRDARIAGDAGCEVVDARDMTRIAELISDRVSVRVASEPRVPFDSTVRIYTGSRRMQLRSRDLSRSGVALWGTIEGACSGDQIELELTLGLEVVVVAGRIVRINDEAHDPNVGLVFDDEADRRRVGQYIDAVLSAHQDRRDSVNSLFDDLTTDLSGCDPLHTADISRVSREDEGSSDDLVELARLSGGGEHSADHHVREVAMALTALERRALDSGGPALLVRGIVLRLRLAKSRAAGSTVASEELFDHCIRFVEELAVHGGAKADLTDMIEIRTWFIRELAAPVGASKQMVENAATDATTAVS